MSTISVFHILEFLFQHIIIEKEEDLQFFQLIDLIPSITNVDSGFDDGHLRNHYNRLKKYILLCFLKNNTTITYRTLQILELIEELDRDSATKSPSSLKEAYCAVAEECTVMHIGTRTRGDRQVFHSFDEAVYMIWKCRVADLEISEASAGLFSEKLRDKWKEMELALDDPVMRRRILVASRTNEKAINSVLAYLDDTFKQMGPSFLEIKAAEILGVNEHTAGSPSAEEVEANNASDGSEMFKDQRRMNDKGITMNRDEGPSSSTHEVLQVRKTVKFNCAHLQNAENARTATISPDELNHNKRIKKSLTENNSSAHTTEWKESIEFLSYSNESPNVSNQFHVQSQKEIRHSPINLLKKRRKPVKWSVVEEDTLRDAVKKHGLGNWKFILNGYSTIFEHRTEVDLKDKWRNMMRFEGQF